MTGPLVTPEAVVLGFEAAGLPSRLLARLLDVTVQLVVLFAVLVGLGFLSGAGVPDVGLFIAVAFVVPLILFGYPVIQESLWRGRTLGKAALGLRVVTVEGAPIRFRHALIRGGADLIDLYGLGILLPAPGIVGVVAIVASKRSQRLGDVMAGTVVVRERAGATVTAPATFVVPPGAETYAAIVDVTGLGARDYQAVRSYLLRASGLRVEARQQVAAELARSIANRIHHVPWADVTPELFLAVVAANIQARGGARPVATPAPAAWGAPPVTPVAGGWGAVPSWPSTPPTPVEAHPSVPSPLPLAPGAPPAPGPRGSFTAPD